MAWALHDVRERAKVLIMVSKLDHCLRDLLYRWRIGDDVRAALSLALIGAGMLFFLTAPNQRWWAPQLSSTLSRADGGRALDRHTPSASDEK
jgi:hypothetical protein